MKKNEKGFMLTEILIVSTIVIGVLVFMYAQFRSINTSLSKTYRYNTVEGLYKTNEIKKFIESDATNEIISALNASSSKYLDVTDCNISLYNNTPFCKILYEKLGAKLVLVIDEDVTELVNSDMNGLENGMKNFLTYVGNNYTGDYYRIVVYYDDNTYATLRISESNQSNNFAYLLKNSNKDVERF